MTPKAILKEILQAPLDRQQHRRPQPHARDRRGILRGRLAAGAASGSPSGVCKVARAERQGGTPQRWLPCERSEPSSRREDVPPCRDERSEHTAEPV